MSKARTRARERGGHALAALIIAVVCGAIVGLLALFADPIADALQETISPKYWSLIRWSIGTLGAAAMLIVLLPNLLVSARRFVRSRGARKFMRNRLAVVSLLVIGVYAFLAVWIAVTNVLNDVGTEADLYTLEDRPVVGLLLRSQIFRPVGPKEMPGFGLEPNRSDRLGAYDEYLDLAGRAFAALEQQSAESEQTPREALDEVAWSARPFADRPIDELRAFYEDAVAERDALVESRLAISGLEGLDDLAEGLAASRAAFEEARSSTDIDLLAEAAEEVAFDLEAFADAASAYARSATPDDPIRAQRPEELAEQANALLDVVDEIYEADEDSITEVVGSISLYDPARVQGVLDARQAAEEATRAHVESRIDAMGLKIETLFPKPTGGAGAVYVFQTLLGTDKQGRSILVRSIYSAKIAIQVGLVTALLAVAFGGVFGAAAAFYGGWVDHVFNWIYSTVTSIPYLVLLAVLSFLFLGSRFEGTLIPLYAAFGLTFWVGPARVVRGEAMKIKELEYVQAATAIGFGKFYILLRHVIPNTSHLLFINFSLLFIGAIKGEVILTFLGLGIKNGASWGLMIDHSKTQVLDQFFWQIGAATFFMFLLVLAFNIFTDALQDAFDPKHVA